MQNNKKVSIIAEVGVNHNGDLFKAKKLIKIASKCGADYVKFQTYKTDHLVTRKAKKAHYQIKNTEKGSSQYQMLKKYELSENDLRTLLSYSKKNNIKFISSVFDISSLNLLKKLKVNCFKIPSGEINNIPLLEEVAKLNKKTIISSGASTIKEIRETIQFLLQSGLEKKKLTILHCVSDYPASLKDINLKAMLYIKKLTKTEVGFSDHTLGIEAAVASVVLGATFIEKHITLDKKLKGPDHKSSLEPKEFANMIQSIRNVELVLSGDGKKNISKNEKKNIKFIRKSIVAKTNIRKGDIFTISNLTTKRPGKGISPTKWKKIIGTKAKKNYLINDFI